MSFEDISNISDFTDESIGRNQIIKVIGVGGGGNNAVNHMFKEGINDVSFVLINTDNQALNSSAIPTKLLLGPGLGAGGSPPKAEKYAEENADKIAELFGDNTDMVFITAGMGGGTGTGAGPVVARIAKELGILTVGIVTIPFLFEGNKRILTALKGAEEMKKNVDALLVINNERLTEIYEKLDIFKAFEMADDTLLNAAKGITEIITLTGHINRDFQDVDSTLRDGGTAIISSGLGEGENRVTKAINNALHTPLLKNTDITSSKKLLMVLYVSSDEGSNFEMSEATELTDFIQQIDQEVDVKWGLYKVPGLGDKVKITLLASGFEVTIDQNPTTVVNKPVKDNTISRDEEKKIISEYGADKAGTIQRGTSFSSAIILDPNDYENEDVLESLDTPTFTRKRPGMAQRQQPSRGQHDSDPGKSIDFSDMSSH